jgi:hypothetical protein
MFAPESQRTSLQSGFEFEVSVRDGIVASLRAIYDRDNDRMIEVVAASARWSLVRLHIFGPGDAEVGPSEQARVFVAEMDVAGRITGMQSYDETDIERAHARFEGLAGM